MQKAVGLRSLAFTVFIVLSALFVSTATWAATTGTLQGTVKSVAGTPLARANVTIVGTGQGATTDAQGRYTFVGLQPATYSIRVQFAGYQIATQQVTVTQDLTSILDFSLERVTIRGTTRVAVPTVPRAQTATGTVITAETEQRVKSQPNNLYQFPGLLFGQPGITYDPGGYVHIRGSDLFQVGFQVDGISIIDPITNEFGTNLVTVGLKSANFYTGGVDASYGNATGGYINEITQNGRDLRGGIIETTVGPGSQWQYLGTNTQIGNATPDNKFDYYASTIRFRNHFPTQGFSVTELPDSQDTNVKLNYYLDPNNTITAFYAYGLENYVYQGGPTSYINQGTGILEPRGSNSQDVQHYELSYLTLNHRFSPTSTLTGRFYHQFGTLDRHLEGFAGQYRKSDFTNDGYQIDYLNQFTRIYQLRAGLQYLPSQTNYHVITGLGTTSFNDPAAAPYGYNDRASLVNPKQTVLYLTNEIKPVGDKLTLDLGLRYSQDNYTNLKRIPDFTDHYTDPRAGLSYSPNRDLVFRTSYARLSQFPETRYLEYDTPEDLGGLFPITAADPAAQNSRIHGRYTPGALKPSYSDNLDLSVEKGFSPFGNKGFFGGAYAVRATTYSKKQYDLLQLNYSSYTGSPYPLYFNNDSRGQSSGLELTFSKRARNPEDINGFVSYTNQVARATSSAFDTGYLPYFSNSLLGTPGLSAADFAAGNSQEFAPTYDQRHTIGAVLSKRFGKVIEPNIVLDAGSGFPYAGSPYINDPNTGNVDFQHGQNNVGGANFTEVPVVLRGNTLNPTTPTVGRTGWHYKVSLNTNFYVTPQTNLFLNVDNVFDRLTTTVFGTANYGGQAYYRGPTAEYPQGQEYYGPNQSITPIFLSFGFRHRF